MTYLLLHKSLNFNILAIMNCELKIVNYEL